MTQAVTFRWSLMSPSDFVKFRLVEFAEDALPVSQLNPGTSWVVYVEAVDSEGTVVTSSTAAMEEGGRPTARQAYSLAHLAMTSLKDAARELGYEVDEPPRLFRAPVPDEYRA